MNKSLIRYVKPLVLKFPALATAYRHHRDSKKPQPMPPMSPMGFRFGGNAAMASGQFEAVETAVVRKLLTDVELFVNVGANIGYYTCIALHAGKQTIAVEPIATNLAHLNANIMANGWASQVEVFPMAVTESSSICKMYGRGVTASLLPGWAGTSENYFDYVPSASLDRLVAPRIDGKKTFILIDVEGAEEGLLRGAMQCLSNNPKPVWMMEISVDEHFEGESKINPKLLETFDHFFQHGYVAYTAGNSPRPVHLEELKKIIASQKNSIDTHNFLFAEKNNAQALLKNLLSLAAPA